MAKSKSGGTRGLLRGRVASDVYSIGKTAEGKTQQVVRSLAESVKNPQTENQMRGRMIMSTVMQAVSALRPVIDHSFDALPSGQPCISEFIRRNYALIKADVAAFPADGAQSSFALNGYQEKGIMPGAYVVADGSVIIPDTIEVVNSATVTISELNAQSTLADLAAVIGITGSGYSTIIGVSAEDGATFVRFSVKANAVMTTTLTPEVFAANIDVEGNTTVSANFVAGENPSFAIFIASEDNNKAGGFIKSELSNGAWHHSSSKLVVQAGSLGHNAQSVLPTYPVGTEQYLNGGDL